MAELTETQLAYVAWRADPERAGNKRDWGAAHKVSDNTLRKWDREPWFRDALDRKLVELNLSPDRMQVILDRLHKEASGGDVTAAKAYMAYATELMPKRTVIEDNAIESLSDAELEAAFRDGLAARAST